VGDGSGTGGSTVDSSGGAALATCEDYCALIGDACQSDVQQYAAGAACEAVCAAMEQGEPGAMVGNTLECRAFYATNAAEAPAENCRRAGPSGDNGCGSNCESFCSLAMVLCTGDNAQWGLVQDCINDCSTYITDPPYSSNVTMGDSFACRMYHLTLASTQPVPHCSHIGPVSATCNDMVDTTGTTG